VEAEGDARTSVKLLSGGNPQIPKGDGEGPVQAYLHALPGWKRDLGWALDGLIVRVVPQVRKAIRWNSPFYGIEGQGWFLSFHCFERYIKVSFLRGAALSPPPPVVSKLAAVRYVHLTEQGLGDQAQLESWILQAASRPGEMLF
jgi:hypothetical protein